MDDEEGAEGTLSNHGEDILSKLNILRKDGYLTDIVFRAQDREFPCHRIIMAATSDYFKALFSPTWQVQAASSVTDLPNVSADIMDIIVEFAYSGQANITTSNVQDLMLTCSQFQVVALEQKCENFMMSQLDSDNCVGLFLFADSYGLCNLKEKAYKKILCCFEEICGLEEFTQLDSVALAKILSEDDLQVRSEETVFEAVVIWIQTDDKDRHKRAAELMQHVRFPYMNTSFLMHHIKNSPLMTSGECQKLINEALGYKLDPDSFLCTSDTRAHPRNCYDVDDNVCIIGGVNGDQIQCEIYQTANFDNRLRIDWQKSLSHLPSELWRFGTCSLDKTIYIMGGERSNQQERRCRTYDAISKSISHMESLPTGMSSHGCARCDDCIYLIGGKKLSSPWITNRVFCYNTKRNQWHLSQDLPICIKRPHAIGFEGSLYVFGGITHDDTDSIKCFKLDPRLSNWQEICPMPSGPRCASTVALNKCIYVVGGYYQHCLKYTPLTNTWVTCKSPSLARGLCAAIPYKGLLYLTGGRDQSGRTTDTIEVYNPSADTWTDAKIRLPYPLFSHGLCTMRLI